MKKNSLLIVLIISSISFSCDVVLEEDITDDLVTTIYPAESDIILSNVVNFQWLELDGADRYRLQILESDGAFLIDSLIQNIEFVCQITPGDYFWRIRGENFAYNSEFTLPIDFTVDVSEDLSNQVVILDTPSDAIYINNTSNLILTWDELNAATGYDIAIDKILSGTQTILQENNISTLSYSPLATLFDDDATYIWKVRGVNSLSQTVFSQHTFYLDRISPNQPQPISPDDNEETTTFNINFSWETLSDIGTVQSPISLYLDIATDIDFNNIIVTYNSSNLSQNHSFSTSGNYYWRLQALDQAGNYSLFSQTRKLILN